MWKTVKLILAILITTLLFKESTSSILPRRLGEIELKYAAFLQVFQETLSNSTYAERFTLLISTFDAYNFFQKDPKYFVRGPGKFLNNITALAEAIDVLDKNAFWPNDCDYVEADVFGFDAIAWHSGFVVPGKTAGQIEVYNLNDLSRAAVNIASQDEEDWYYHRSVWMDVNKDGRIDAVSARFKNPSALNPARSELTWFENPGGELTPGWKQHVLVTDGPDVHFSHLYITNSVIDTTFDCILAAEFWNKELNLYCVIDAPTASWTNSSQLLQIPVDLEAGQTFDCMVGDLNNDGRDELITTTYFRDDPQEEGEGFVFAYEIPQDFPNGAFTRRVIAFGFIAHATAGDSMSPGSGKLFHRHIAERGAKPSVMLSGDDDGCHYILTPLTEDQDDWSYSKDLLVNTTMKTSGKFVVEDLDGDGWTDIIAAGYTSGTLYVYTFAPAIVEQEST